MLIMPIVEKEETLSGELTQNKGHRLALAASGGVTTETTTILQWNWKERRNKSKLSDSGQSSRQTIDTWSET